MVAIHERSYAGYIRGRISLGLPLDFERTSVGLGLVQVKLVALLNASSLMRHDLDWAWKGNNNNNNAT